MGRFAVYTSEESGATVIAGVLKRQVAQAQAAGADLRFECLARLAIRFPTRLLPGEILPARFNGQANFRFPFSRCQQAPFSNPTA
jgi:hypothetical protein